MTDLFAKLPLHLLARRDVSPTGKLIFALLSDHARGAGKAWPGLGRLAAACGVSRNAVLRAIAALEHVKLVEVDRQPGSGKSNAYRLQTGSGAEMELAPKRHATGAEMEPEAVPKRNPKQKEKLNRGGAPAPRATSGHLAEPGGNGAGQRIVAGWIDGYRQAVGRDYPRAQVGRLAGTVARLLGDYAEGELSAAVGRWFGAIRASYGPGLFAARLADGDADLYGRQVQAKGRQAPAADAGLAAAHAAALAAVGGSVDEP